MSNLFKGIKKDLSNAHIGWVQDNSNFISHGYLIGARKLTSNFSTLSVRDRDSLSFPIVFLYRQHIEVTLKILINWLHNIKGTTSPEGMLGRHKLLPLWDETTTMYFELIETCSISLVFTENKGGNERAIINEFNKVDEDSFSFRYAEDKKRNKNLQDIEYISIDFFKEEIEKVVSFLEKVNDTLSHYEQSI